MTPARRPWRSCFLAATVLLLTGLLPAGTSDGDEIVLRSGRTYRGFARREGAEVVVNTFGCSAPEMTLGVRRFRAIDVREIQRTPLEDHIHRVLAELSPYDVPRRVDLLRQAQSGRLRELVTRVAAEILVRQPTHEEALRAVGGEAKWTALRRGRHALVPRLALDLRRVLRLESGAERRDAVARLKDEHGYAGTADAIERMVRSLRARRGLRRNVALRMLPRGCERGRYTLYVPPDYDPLVPRPLLLALHGGGIMTEKGPSVRGSAKDALAHFLDGAREKGWFLCCPDAVEAPWTTSANLAFLDAVLEEVATLWNIDLDRLHLAGQGGGGDGVWFFASRRAARFASVAVASAGKPKGVSVISGKAFLWLYHGDADEIVPVEPVRKTATTLLKRKAAFVYCELPKEGHGLPPPARRDLFRCIAPKRRRKAESAWPAPSFAVPTSRAAREMFGDPAAAWGGSLPDDASAEDLVGRLALGRSDAEPAARRLARVSNEAKARVVATVRTLVREQEAPRAARLWGTWLLGVWRDEGAVDVLGTVLRTSRDVLLLRRAAEAVGAIGSRDSVQDLHWALGDCGARYRSLRGERVRFQDFAQTCALGAAVADAIGVVGEGDDTFFAELEESLVRHVLMDPRPVVAVAAHGEDPTDPRTKLAVSVARTYMRLGAEKTLYDMLRLAVRKDEQAAQAVQRVLRRGPR